MKDHKMHHTSNNNIYIDFSIKPSEVVAGEKVKMSFEPLDSESDSLVSLQKIHEKDMHLLIVNSDLSYFCHLHPLEVNHCYVQEHRFPYAGNYHLFVDCFPEGSEQLLSRHNVKVTGAPVESCALPDEETAWERGGYKLFIPENQLPLKAGKMLEITLSLENGKRPLKDLDYYLGALAHVVIISEDIKEFLHVHPMESDTMGPEIKLHTTFPHPGKYKMFIQFNHQDKIHTASLVLNVVAE